MRLLWLTFKDRHKRRKPWHVYLSDERPGKDSDAEARPRPRTITIYAGCPYWRIFECLEHEIVHAAIDEPENNNDATLQLQDAAEEYVARRIEGGLWPVFASLGAKLPPFPTGFRELRRRCRRTA